MPIYEYQCDGCAYRFEVKQSIKDDPIASCERCGKPVRRLISSPGIMFKGSGWYVTDYSDKLKPSSSGEKPAAGSGESKDSTSASTSPSTASSTPAQTTTSSTPAAPSTTPSTPPTTK